jgi:AcrR family transcriptional regulator
MPEQPSTRDRIIGAVLEIIEHEGVRAVTTRRIARTAGVNTAAVNYHFGSKDRLLGHVFEITLRHGFDDWRMILDEESLPMPTRVYCLLLFMLEGIERYPGIVRFHFFESHEQDPGRRRFVEEVGSFLDDAAALLSRGSVHDESTVRLSLAQMISTVVFTGLVPGMTEALASSPGDRTAFIGNLMRCFLGMEPDLSPKALEQVEELRRRAFGG